jgi:hypothetical protein
VFVLSPGVVEHLDAVEDLGPRFLASHVNPALDALAFEALEEALGASRSACSASAICNYVTGCPVRAIGAVSHDRVTR